MRISSVAAINDDGVPEDFVSFMQPEVSLHASTRVSLGRHIVDVNPYDIDLNSWGRELILRKVVQHESTW